MTRRTRRFIELAGACVLIALALATALFLPV